ncbi:hypothetical protein [Bosea sp. (in: a-proteobacteria)]|uniref:hypothetical protein n=1 Tax=Bosea sp. (in: a-proteobacteria) TaxID=1871050 RepID=UPI0025BA6353|nr:hypothetical protein [Bosea sp. (in: a-proteobacteria)]MBR3190450.1 hypothetical protein [Bosea sp. (in: a-proteobacteria)]
MTTSTDSAAGIGLPYAPHDSEMALGGFLALSATPLAATRSPRLSGLAFEAERHSYLAIPDEPDMAPAFSALARLRWQIEEEIERLIGVLDQIDVDADYEQTACETRGGGFPGDLSGEDEEDGRDAEALDYPLSAGGRS